MQDFHTFVEETNKCLEQMINKYDYDTVWVTESVDYVEWRRDAYAVRLCRDSSGSVHFSCFQSNQRCGAANCVVMDDVGVKELANAIVDYAGGRNRVYRTLYAVK